MKIPKYTDLPTGSVDENTLKQVTECMNSDRFIIWYSVQLHFLYSDMGEHDPIFLGIYNLWVNI